MTALRPPPDAALPSHYKRPDGNAHLIADTLSLSYSGPSNPFSASDPRRERGLCRDYIYTTP